MLSGILICDMYSYYAKTMNQSEFPLKSYAILFCNLMKYEMYFKNILF